MIVIEELTKSYKRRSSTADKKYENITAINNLNLKINKGETFGLIGPNGAGKTTTLKILSTLVLPDKGSVEINGYDVVKDSNQIKNEIGLLAGEFARSLYWRLTGIQNLKFFAQLKGMWDADERINELIELFDLKDHKNDQVMKYSTGMKHKLAFAIGLLNNPPVLFLDEPLTGMDPLSAFEIKKMIKTEFKDKTIIWASHNLFEIEEMCDRIALINNGEITLLGEPEILKKAHWDHIKILITTSKPEKFESFENVEIKKDTVEIKVQDVSKSLIKISEFVKEKNIEIIDIKTIKPTLEEIFMEGVKNAK